MKVEILYFSGCPNYHPAVARLSDILRQEAVHAELVEVEIKDAGTAHMMRFLGSPSIRINGRDVEPTARSSRAFGMTCRTYIDDGNGIGSVTLDRYGRGENVDQGGSAGVGNADIFLLATPYTDPPPRTTGGLCGGAPPTWQNVHCLNPSVPARFEVSASPWSIAGRRS